MKLLILAAIMVVGAAFAQGTYNELRRSSASELLPGPAPLAIAQEPDTELRRSSASRSACK